MNKNTRIHGLLAFIVAGFISFHSFAQEETPGVAKIKKIATISEGKIEEYKEQTTRAQLRRNDQKNWIDVKKNDELFYNDILKLDKDIWLRLNVKNKLQSGNITFSSNPEDLNEPGRYKILNDQDGSGRVAIELEQGVAVFSVVKNAVSTITTGLTSSVESGSTTRAYFLTRADKTGEIYLQQGHLTFPGNEEFSSLKEGQVAQFQNGQITKIFVPDVSMMNKYNDLIKFNNSTVWKKPFFKRPAVWAGAAAIGVSAALMIIKPWDSGNDQVTGTVNVTWGSN